MTITIPQPDLKEILEITETELPPLTTLTKTQQVIRVLDQAVATKGADYVYRATGGPLSPCYVINRDGSWRIRGENLDPLPENQLQASCLVGWVLAGLGFSLPSLVPMNDTSLDHLIEDHTGVRKWFRGEPALQVALADLQGNQDNKMPWGEAVAQFKTQLGVPA